MTLLVKRAAARQPFEDPRPLGGPVTLPCQKQKAVVVLTALASHIGTRKVNDPDGAENAAAGGVQVEIATAPQTQLLEKFIRGFLHRLSRIKNIFL